MPKFIQNISDETQLVRIQWEKQILKPGEVAEVTDTEAGVSKTYSKLFQEVTSLDAPKPVKNKSTPEVIEKKPKDMNKADLKAYGATLGIELDTEKTKGQMLADLEAGIKAQEDEKSQQSIEGEDNPNE